MMKRFMDRQFSDMPVDTFSVFARESLKGYVYIEANRVAHVQNVRISYRSSLTYSCID